VINSGVKYTKKNSFLSKKEKFKVIGSDAVINEVKKQKTIGIFIVGETARIGTKAKIPICIINGIDSNSNASLVFCSLILSIILVSIN
jgi:hypothetical protein